MVGCKMGSVTEVLCIALVNAGMFFLKVLAFETIWNVYLVPNVDTISNELSYVNSLGISVLVWVVGAQFDYYGVKQKDAMMEKIESIDKNISKLVSK